MVKRDSLVKFKYYVRSYFYEISCCDLCGQQVGITELNNQHLEQALVCQYCLDGLTYFKQNSIVTNLLNWPAVHRSLPNILFDTLFAISPYVYPFDLWLSQLKYSGRFELAKLLATILAAQWKTSHHEQSLSTVDLVISIPLHVKKWRERGFNQSHLIGQCFAKKLSLNYDANVVKKIKHTTSQMGKTGPQRRKHLKDSFVLQKKLAKNIRHVVIVDDVVTTGTTASEVSRLFKNAGVETVSVVAVCLVIPH